MDSLESGRDSLGTPINPSCVSRPRATFSNQPCHRHTMPLVLPTIDQLDAYLDSVEQIVVTSLSAATPDLGQVSEAINRLWQDVLRHSPQAVPASLKGLGAFEVPPPPPPPPPPRGLWENTADWVADHPWTLAGLGIGVVGAGLLVGYASPRFHRRTRVGARRHVAPASTERRQVIGESSCPGA